MKTLGKSEQFQVGLTDCLSTGAEVWTPPHESQICSFTNAAAQDKQVCGCSEPTAVFTKIRETYIFTQNTACAFFWCFQRRPYRATPAKQSQGTFFVTGNTKTLFPTETIWPSCGSPLTLTQPIIAQTGEEGHDWEPEGKTETHTLKCVIAPTRKQFVWELLLSHRLET